MNTVDANRGSQILVSLFIPFLIFIALPLEIYHANIDQIAFHYSAIAGVHAKGFAIAAFALLTLVLVLKPWRDRIGRVLLALSFCVWISSSFFGTYYGVFNGTALAVDVFSPLAMFEVAIWVLLIAIILCLKSGLKRAWEAAWVLFLLVLVTTTYRVYQAYESELTLIQSLNRSVAIESLHDNVWQDFPTFSEQRNILYVILDEAQGSVVEYTLARNPDIANNLKGFHLFEDVAAVFPYTVASLPAILSGEIYNNDTSRDAYLERVLSGNAFFDYLESSRYRREFHIHPLLCGQGLLEEGCSGMPASSSLDVSLTLLDFALLRVSPVMATNLVYSRAQGLFSKIFGSRGYLESTTGIAFLKFAELNEGIEVADIPPTYKLFQTLISHAPIVLDENCTLLSTAEPNELEPISAQTVCAFRMVLDLMAALEAKGILDNTMIIISSDHGGNFVPEEFKSALVEANIPSGDFSRADATLLVKPFNARGELRFVDTPLQLSQIGALIEGMGGGKQDVEHLATKLSLQSTSRRYNAFDMILGKDDSERLHKFRSYCIDGPVSQPASWKTLNPDLQTGCGDRK